MIRITLKSGIVVEGNIASNQPITELPSITLTTNYPKIIKTYNNRASVATGSKHVNGADLVYYSSHSYTETIKKPNALATIFISTIAKQEEI